MDFNEFKNSILEQLQMILPDHTIKTQSVLKNNGLLLDGIVIKAPGQSVCPTIYLNDFYDALLNEHQTIDDLVEEIVRIYRTHTASGLCRQCQDYFQDFNSISSRIVYRIIDADENQQFLEDVPHRLYLNLAIIYYIIFDSDGTDTATAVIHNSHLKLWGITAGELEEYAMVNTPRLLPLTFECMENLLRDMLFKQLIADCDDCSEPEPDQNLLHILDQLIADQNHIPMWVLSNKCKLYGATSILYPEALQQCSETLGGDFYVLPSSVHEVILIPTSFQGDSLDRQQLLSMVSEINCNEVALPERLTDTVYRYDQERGCLVP